jgi:hypothetical protein
VPPKEPIGEGYSCVPPGARRLELKPADAAVTAWNEERKVAMQDKAGTIPVGKTDVVWRIAVKPLFLGTCLAIPSRCFRAIWVGCGLA